MSRQLHIHRTFVHMLDNRSYISRIRPLNIVSGNLIIIMNAYNIFRIWHILVIQPNHSGNLVLVRTMRVSIIIEGRIVRTGQDNRILLHLNVTNMF